MLDEPAFSVIPLPIRQILAATAIVVGVFAGFWRHDGKSLWTWLWAAVRFSRLPRRAISRPALITLTADQEDRWYEGTPAAGLERQAGACSPPGSTLVSRLGVVQQIVTRYRAIADDTLFLGDGQLRAIFEVFPPNLSLADDDALEAAAQQLAVVLNALAFPTQLLFRFVAVDLESLAVEAERAAATRGPELARAARDYAALLRYLSRTQVLLELHVYLIVGIAGARGSLLQALVSRPLGWLSRLSRRCPAASVAGSSEIELLDERGEQVTLELAAIGGRPRRLDNVEIAELLYVCWCPERAHRQPLRIERRAA